MGFDPEAVSRTQDTLHLSWLISGDKLTVAKLSQQSRFYSANVFCE
jgi:hypothetical protein